MISALAVLLLALVLPLATPALVSPAKAASAAELEFVRLINEYRQANGRSALLISEKASTAARRHSSDMGTYRFFDHKTIRSSWFAAGSSFSQRLNASGYTGWGAVGENIAAGQSTAAAVFTAWRNSSGHNANMLNPSYRVIGIGLAYVSGSPFGSYWTTDFGDKVDSTAYNPAKPGPFKDVSGVHPNVTAITDLTKEGVISGYTDGTFHPSASVLRMQFAKMIVLALGLPCSEADAVRFRDVAPTGSATLYPDNYIAVAYRKGITNGTSATTYSPKSNISRAQTVTMVVRAVEKLHPGKLQNPPSGYVAAWRNLGAPHDATVRKAQYNGLLAGLPVSQLSPTGAMTRAEVAQILFNMQTKIGR
jgi:uncharacterized protein YkwD